MRILLTTAGVLVALVFIGVSAAMNVTFVSSLGRTPFESQLFGAVSLACDAAKALLPVFCAVAIHNRQRLRAAIGLFMFALFTMTSFLSAVGFTAVNRMTVATMAEDRTAQRFELRRELAAIEARIAAMPTHRPASVVVEALSASQLDRRWTLSKQCTDVTDPRSRQHCEGYFGLRAEHAAALEADKLEARHVALKAQVASASPASGIDPQAGLVAGAFAMEPSTIQRVLVLLMALIVELGSGFGLYLAWQPIQRPDLRKAPSDAQAIEPLKITSANADAPTIVNEPDSKRVDEVDSHAPPHDPDIMRAVLRRPNGSINRG